MFDENVITDQNISDFNTLTRYGVNIDEIADLFEFKIQTNTIRKCISKQSYRYWKPINSNFVLLDSIDHLYDYGDNMHKIANKLGIPFVVVKYVIEMT